MNSPSSLARAAVDKASASFDGQAVILRKNDSENTGTDAFAQIFASTQKKEPREDLKPRDTAPDRAPIAPKPRHADKVKSKDSCDKSDETADAKDAKDQDQADAADSTQEAKDSAAAHHADKKQEKKDCAKKDDQSDGADEAAAAAAPAEDKKDTAEVPTDIVDVAPDQTADTPDTVTPAACFAPMLKAQEAASAEATANKDDSKEQEPQQADAALNDLLSFRPNPGAGAKAAGQKSGAGSADGTADAAAGFNAHVKTAAGKKAAPEAQLAQNPQGDAGDDFASAAHTTAPKKAEEPRGIAPEKTEAANANSTTDTHVSPTPPAAGSRVNAQLGFPAPSPTGSGSGSPSAHAAGGNGVDAASAVNSVPATTRLEEGAPVQLTKTARPTFASPAAEQVSIGLTRLVKNGGSSFEVQLSPAELGKVEIKLDIAKDGTVKAVVTSDNPATHDMLQKDSSALQKVLADAGLKTDSGSLSFNLRGEAQQQDAYQQPAPKAWQRWMDNALTADAAPQTEFYSATPGRVDMRI